MAQDSAPSPVREAVLSLAAEPEAPEDVPAGDEGSPKSTKFWKGSPKEVLVKTLCMFTGVCLCVCVVISVMFGTASALVPAIGVTLIDSTGFAAYEGDVSFLMWTCSYIMPHLFMTLVIAIFEYSLLVRFCRFVMRAQASVASFMLGRLEAAKRKRAERKAAKTTS